MVAYLKELYSAVTVQDKIKKKLFKYKKNNANGPK